MHACECVCVCGKRGGGGNMAQDGLDMEFSGFFDFVNLKKQVPRKLKDKENT